jgi:hypothetical protein
MSSSTAFIREELDMVGKRTLLLAFMLCTIQTFGLGVVIKNSLDAPQSPYGRIFAYDDWLEYLDDGTLVYLGCYPPNLYAVEGDKYVKLIERYRNPIYETRDPKIVVTELLRSHVKGELLYYARTRGAEQESYRVFPRPVGGAAVEPVDKDYWTKNVDRMTPADYSLKGGYFLDLQESTQITGGLNPAIRDKSGSAFILDEAFSVGFIEHFGQIAISPDKKNVAMIVSYHEKETGRSVNRLVVLKLEYDDAGLGGARQN